MGNADLDDLLILSLVRGLGPTLTRRCIEAFGSPAMVVRMNADRLADVDGIGKVKSQSIRAHLDELSDGKLLAREKELIAQWGVNLIAEDDPGYPRLLRLIPDPPPLLYVRGKLQEDDALALGVVGSRKASAYGREQADRLASLCAQAGLCINSGGARGIDGAAHRAAIRAGGRTVAVIGSGLARPYPPEHAELFDTIADGPGAVISELPMTAPPAAENFPRRNRIISGLSLGVLVIEAAKRSGALITARLATEEHGREVMALPGRVDSPSSAGCHKMIREGWATLVTGAADIMDALGDAGQMLKAGLTNDAPGDTAGPRAQKLTDSQRRLVDCLTEPLSTDQLAAQTGLAMPILQADLTMLEITGTVRRDRGRYARAVK